MVKVDNEPDMIYLRPNILGKKGFTTIKLLSIIDNMKTAQYCPNTYENRSLNLTNPLSLNRR